MESIPKILFFLFLCSKFEIYSAEEGLITVIDDKFQNKLSEYTNYAAKWLEDFNDRHIGNSEIGKLLRYDVLKPKFGASAREGKNMKKMSMALIPLIFHVGATSTWMVLTSIMAVKSVAIGLTLLVFKIAVSSAKVASFFTSLKAKHSGPHHGDWSWSPHYDHHGHERSLSEIGSHLLDWSSYTPESQGPPGYKTIPQYKSHDEHFEEEDEYSEETKKLGHVLHRGRSIVVVT